MGSTESLINTALTLSGLLTIILTGLSPFSIPLGNRGRHALIKHLLGLIRLKGIRLIEAVSKLSYTRERTNNEM
uniref:AlNc14C109G6334 protein n=1 Tax=Albugo laibachii Nc14 TaxID=890382 RepID=F0WID3_9STRA|nr:AlNc14C109G6334 [Albugo laibachii Nc14]|eukprot:CCA21014.1 AlNc14C109G6334 [Albugo laibachii Nc14]